MKDFLKRIINEEVKKPNLNELFYKWFNNSKVVDEYGAPLQIYYNSKNKNTNNGLGFGIKLTQEKDNNSIPVFCKIENPIYLNKLYFRKDNEKLFFNLIKLAKYLLGDKQFNKLYDKNQYYEDISGNKQETMQSIMLSSFILDKLQSDKVKEAILSYNYDGIIYEDSKTYKTAYIVFKMNQIKSVDNSGYWDDNNEDIKS